MRAVAEQNSISTSPKVLGFPSMGKQQKKAAEPRPAPPVPEATWWQRNGNTAQWCAVIVALIGVFGNTALTLWFHHAEHEAKSSDEHTNSLIEDRLKPAVKQIGDDIDKKLSPVTSDLSALKLDMAGLKAKMEQLNLDLNRSTKLQLDKLSEQIVTARRAGKAGDVGNLRNIGYDLLSLSAANKGENSARAGQVANELLGYYSFSVQADAFVKAIEKYGFAISGASREQECIRGGPGPWPPRVFIQGAIWENCTIRLDDALAHSVAFERNLFKNVTVVYAGGHVVLKEVAFVDCTFELAVNEPSRRLGETLLAAAHVEHFETP